MSDDPYHWRNLAADEKMADEIRALLKMPNLEFQSVLAEVSVVIDRSPEVEIQESLRRMGCELTTTPVGRTKIAFKHRRHLADKVILVAEAVRYACFAYSVWCFYKMMHSSYRSEFLYSDILFTQF